MNSPQQTTHAPRFAQYFTPCATKSFSPGQTIFLKGDAPDGIHFVQKGCVRISVVSDDGRELSFELANENDIFGEIAVLDGRARSASATALTKVETAFLPTAIIENRMENDPGFSKALVELLCHRIRHMNDHLEGLAHHPVEARLARYLLRLCQEHETDCLNLRVSQSELGFLLGAARQHINRAMGTLEATGAVRREGRVCHCDRAALQEIAGI